MTSRFASAFDFSILPADQGQIVEIAYAVDFQSDLLIRRTIDRSESDATAVYAFAEIDCDGATTFEPQNGVLPDVGEWTACSR